MIYQNEELVKKLTRECVDAGDTVFQIHWLANTEREHVAKLLNVFDPHGIVLDAGCGIGGVSKIMREIRSDLDFVLLNISQAQLDMCPDNFVKVKGSFHDMPLPSGSVDCVMFNYSLGHGDVETCFKEADRVMRHGGVLFVYDLATQNNQRLVESLEYYAYSVTEMLDAAESNGFALLEALSPISPYTDHFLSKMDKEKFDIIFEDVQPVMLRFVKE